MSEKRSAVWSAVTLLAALLAAAPALAAWKTLEPGLELGEFKAANEAPVGDSRITILRIDANRWTLELGAISHTGEESGHTARQWCAKRGWIAAINAGMFGTDYRTHVGYARAGDHVNNSNLNSYQSVAATGSLSPEDPPFRIFDLDDPAITMSDIRTRYATVVQNLRLIKRPGENRWPQQEKRWSEAALGEDTAGRALFILVRAPFTMHDLNEELLGLGIDLACAQHLEGGPAAQLYVAAGGVELELVGSFETAFRENDGNLGAWPIPNVLGVRRAESNAP